MKNIYKIGALVLLLVIFVGCGQNQEVQYINIPTASTTGTLYPFGNAIANLWNDNVNGIRANAQASNGGIDNLNLLEKGEANISMAVTSNVYQSYKGLEAFEGRANDKIRIITGLYYNPNQVIVSESSGINSLEDVKGHRFAPGSPGSTTEYEASIHLKYSGLNYPDDINAQYVNFTEAIDLVRNKQVEGAWIMAGAPTSAVTEMLKTTDTKLLEIPKNLVDEMKIDYPWYSNYTLKAGTYEELTEDMNTSAIKMVMFTSSDMDDDLIYELTKIFWENIEELKKTHNFLKEVTIEGAVTDIADLPLHEGALRYYKEIGIIE
ncbi:MAG: TAXI family TRAP transporter solute-binding subunit [Tissierellia bacterium]|nr:TAXI family TRAP transporter solute-binding subunit [Tissierellia bacterium]